MLARLLCFAFVLAVAPAALAGSLPFTIKFQVYEGPHDGTGQKWKSRTVEIVPGSASEREFLENYAKSNPGLVASYRELTQNTAFRNYLGEIISLKGDKPTITLVDDSKKYVDADKDGKPDTDEKAREERGVWPHARGKNLYISQSYFGSYPNLQNVRELLIHEISHTQDDTRRGSGDYGPDGDHYADEVLRDQACRCWPKFWKTEPRYAFKASFLEGWANFTPLLFDPSMRADVLSSVDSLRIEGEKGKYTDIDWEKASFDQLLAVEHINSLILFDIYRFVPDGKKKIFDAFKATNRGSRTLLDLLASLVANNPADAYTVAAIFDAYTGFKASRETLEKLLGKELADKYIKEHRDKLKQQNTSGTVAGAESVGRYASANLRIASAEDALEVIDRRIEKLSGWSFSPWDLLGGPASFLIRNWLEERDANKLKQLRARLQAELERMRQQRPVRGFLGSVMLPPPATEPAEETGSTTGTAPTTQAGKPAGKVAGERVEWGR